MAGAVTEGTVPLVCCRLPSRCAYLVLGVNEGSTLDEVLQAVGVARAHGHVEGGAPDLGGEGLSATSSLVAS